MPFCSQCGASLVATARFCGSCGSPVASGSPAPVARAAPATAYGVTNTSNARVPVNAANPDLYRSGGSSPSPTRSYSGGGGSGIYGSGGSSATRSGGGSGIYGSQGGGAGVPVNAAFPERYGGSPASSPTPSRSYGGGGGGGSGIYGSGGSSATRSGGGSGIYGSQGGGAGVPVNAASAQRYGGSPASSPGTSRAYGGGSGGGSPAVSHKKTWEQVRCPGCGASLSGRATVTIVHKEWHTECWQRMSG